MLCMQPVPRAASRGKVIAYQAHLHAMASRNDDLACLCTQKHLRPEVLKAGVEKCGGEAIPLGFADPEVHANLKV